MAPVLMCGAQEGTNAVAVRAQAIRGRLEESVKTLAALRASIADEKIPLSKDLSAAEQELLKVRREADAVRRRADGSALEISGLKNEIRQRETERNYLMGLFGEYVRNFETRLHVAELELYREPIENTRSVLERAETDAIGAFNDQLRLIFTSVGRLEELAGGMKFAGKASGADGLVKAGQYMLFGPVAYFLSDDGSIVGAANQRVGSLMPVIAPYSDARMSAELAELIRGGKGVMPFDPTLGNAYKTEELKETLTEHFLKGGPVMWPMLWLLVAAGLVVVFKWIWMSFIRMPRADAFAKVLAAVGEKRFDDARAAAAALPGPVGRMIRTGTELLEQPKDLIEEAMFEKMLEAKSSLNRFIPFVAVSAACAPLLGLLGTVTGIISTFKMMTVFGSSDIKALSSGISEALITTEFGLYIAIPSVLLHSFLSRKSKGLAERMEQCAIRFMGEIGKN